MSCRSRSLIGIGAWILLSVAPATSGAAITLFTNFGPGFSYNTSSGNNVGNAFDGNNYAEGDSFTPAFTAQFTSLDITLNCFFLCPDTFTVSLDANNGGVPGLPLESFSVPGTALGAFGTNNQPLVLTSILQPLLLAATPYWISVSSDLNDSIVWNLNTTGNISTGAISTNGGSSWFAPSGLTPGAYQVSGIVPEPSAAVLLGTGLLILGTAAKGRPLLRRIRASVLRGAC